MKVVLLALFALLGTSHVQAADVEQSVDTAAIEQAVENWNTAWKVEDPKLAAQDYSDDADWTNAFGMTRVGRADIEQLLTEVFALPFVMAALMFMVSGEYMRLLFSDPFGRLMVGAALASLTVGALVMRQMVRFEV